MADKRVALDLAINLKKGDITIEELNAQLAEAKKQMEEIGDEGSEEFAALGKVVDDTEAEIEKMNATLKKTKKGFEDTGKAQEKSAKGSKKLSNGFKGIGTALKAAGIGFVVAAFKGLSDALGQNQGFLDNVNAGMKTLSNVFSQAFGIITDVYNSVAKSTGNFNALGKVMNGILELALYPFKATFLGIKIGIDETVLAWENSVFGSGDAGTIRKLNASLKATRAELANLNKNTSNSAKAIQDNFNAAMNEVGTFTSEVVDRMSEIDIKATFAQEKAAVRTENAAKLAAAQQTLLVEKYDQQAESLRQVRDEERNSIAERKKANDELKDVLDKQEKAMLAQADLQIKAAKNDVDRNDNIENQVALTEALANREGILAQINGFRSEQKMNDLALDREAMELTKSIGDSEAKLAADRRKFNAEQITDKLESLKALRDIAEETQQEEMLRLEGIVEMTKSGTQAEADALIALNEYREQIRQENLINERAILDEIDKRRKESSDKDAKDAEQVAKNKIKLATDTLSAVANISSLFAKKDEASAKKQFELQKAISIGQTVISTYEGAQNAFTTAQKSPLTIGFPAYPFIQAGLAAVAGAAQVKKIASTQYQSTSVSPASTGGGGTPNLGGGEAGIQPIGFTSPVVGTDVPTTKVIVTETDIRNVSRNVDGVYSRATVVQ